MYQNWLINCNKCVTQGQDVNYREIGWGKAVFRNTLYFLFNFFYKPETTPRNKLKIVINLQTHQECISHFYYLCLYWWQNFDRCASLVFYYCFNCIALCPTQIDKFSRSLDFPGLLVINHLFLSFACFSSWWFFFFWCGTVAVNFFLFLLIHSFFYLLQMFSHNLSFVFQLG